MRENAGIESRSRNRPVPIEAMADEGIAVIGAARAAALGMRSPAAGGCHQAANAPSRTVVSSSPVSAMGLAFMLLDISAAPTIAGKSARWIP